MSTLTEDQHRRMIVETAKACPHCKKAVKANYCRDCDVYFTLGHDPQCPTLTDEKNPNNHAEHRHY